MKKRKLVKSSSTVQRKHLTAKWEILSVANYVLEHFPNNAPLPPKALMAIYQGAAVPCIQDGLIDEKQRWGVTILTTVRMPDGSLQPHDVSWRIDEPISFKDFMRGNPDIKVERGNGLKTRWIGVAEEWKRITQEEIPDGLVIVSAWATANCMAVLRNNGIKPGLLAKYFKTIELKSRMYLQGTVLEPVYSEVIS
ncbi:hypothetical protein [Alkanindiges illinoisensis]|uniref:hypothetical protein n=1 Tax=Alkanindiges illinoisensis TaxID=197183 RepID=UPI0012EC477F|nr:hypothetical protein [Alkanindiges illinoisensis]